MAKSEKLSSAEAKKAIRRVLREVVPNPLDADGADGEIAPLLERRRKVVKTWVPPAIGAVLQERARMYCNGNLNEWMVWAALEFRPPRRKLVVNGGR